MPHTPLRLAFRRPWPGTRRGFCLWLISLAIMVLGGINYVITPIPPASRMALAFALDITHGNIAIWGYLMVTVGAVACFCSFCHFGRDRYGFLLVTVFCAGWGLMYLTGLLFGAGLRAVGLAVIWLLFAGLFTVVAGFPNVRLGAPPPPLLAPDDTPPTS